MKIARNLLPLLFMSSAAFAHPGHGQAGESTTHLLTDPYHVGLAVVAIALVIGVARLRHRTSARVRR
ncbi:MAG: hypothetical protein GY944_07015 [bacterium]|nr:hypothetical protein [bacterium]